MDSPCIFAMQMVKATSSLDTGQGRLGGITEVCRLYAKNWHFTGLGLLGGMISKVDSVTE